MEIVYDDEALAHYMTFAVEASDEHPVLIDKFLDQAIEMDVDAVRDRAGRVLVAGLMEHIEEAGIHSGDSACALPPYSLPASILERVKAQTITLANALNVVGLMNVQYAIRGDQIYVLEVNPRASRTVPFVSKATGVPWAKLAAKVMAGATLDGLGAREVEHLRHTAVKESVFPFAKFPGVDVILGPEMRSTGEVMGIDESFDLAYAKSQLGTGQPLPLSGTVFLSVKNADKREIVGLARQLAELGFELTASEGTADVLARNRIPVRKLRKISVGRPNVLDLMKNKEVKLLINTVSGKTPRQDEIRIRNQAIANNIPLVTTISAARAVVSAIVALKKQGLAVKTLQEYAQEARGTAPGP
jgi:carbamoyl-phosphate synthase large subunit